MFRRAFGFAFANSRYGVGALGGHVRFATTSSETNSMSRSSSTPRSTMVLPPAMDIIKFNDADLDKGYMLRLQYINNCVVLNYMKQNKTEGEVISPPTARHQKFGAAGKIVVLLPTMFMARFLGVLEGTMDKCTIASRTTQGTFGVGQEKGTFELVCKSSKPDSGESVDWACVIDTANGLMMQRFFVEALHYNSGF